MVGFYNFLNLLTVIFVIGVTNALPPQKIIGGSLATLGEFPHIVSLRVQGQHLCGGTIISEKHIVTAAHCVAGVVTHPYTDLVVVTGTISSYSGKTHVVKSALYHTKFDRASQASPNDIAIIVLAADIKFDQNTKKATLPTAAPPSGVMATVAGWGYTSRNGGVAADRLGKVQVKTLSSTECQKHMRGLSVLYKEQICTKDAPGRGVCQGDSGGPLMYNGQFIGVVSYNIPCGLGFPDVYTSVFHYLDWIKQVKKMP